LTTLSQSQLQRQIEILVANGKAAPAQPVMATIGYTAPALDAGHELLQTWLAHQSRAKALLATQKQATQAEWEARQAAHLALSSLSQTVRILFGADPTVLTALGLPLRRSRSNGAEAGANGNGNGQTAPRLRPDTTPAAMMARWRLILANIQTLSEAQQQQLAEAGWNAEHLAAAAALVEACAVAHTRQKQKIQAYRAEAEATRSAEAALRQWYHQAARLSRLAIKQADPHDRARLQGLLGLS
jgi:hypothetical protein